MLRFMSVILEAFVQDIFKISFKSKDIYLQLNVNKYVKISHVTNFKLIWESKISRNCIFYFFILKITLTLKCPYYRI